MASRRRDVCDIDSISAARKSSDVAANRLVEHLIFHPLTNFGEQIGLLSVQLRQVPDHLILPGWPVFQREGGEIRIGLPMVMGPYPTSRYTGISGPALPQIIEQVRAALLVEHPNLRGRR